MFVTCGDWDLLRMLPTQLKREAIKTNNYFKKWINIKHSFTDHYKTKAYGMTGMLEYLKLELIGRHHSGIDDSRNIARIAVRMMADGYKFRKPSV